MLLLAPAVSWRGPGRPKVSPRAFVHETAVLIGEVIVEDNVIIFPQVVLRADEGFPIVIGEDSNIQDGVIMHCLKGGEIRIGRGCTVAHGAMVHGPCRIGDGCFLGFRALVAGATVGSGCFISPSALVMGVEIAAGKFVPPALIVDDQAKAGELGVVPDAQKAFLREVRLVNQELLHGYRELGKT